MPLTSHEALDELLTLPVVLCLRYEARTYLSYTHLLYVFCMPSTVQALGAMAKPEADTILALLHGADGL